MADIDISNRWYPRETTLYCENLTYPYITDARVGTSDFLGDLADYNIETNFYYNNPKIQHSYTPYLGRGLIFDANKCPWVKAINLSYFIQDGVAIQGVDFGTIPSFKNELYSNYGDSDDDRTYIYCYIDRINSRKTIRVRWSNNAIEGADVGKEYSYNFSIPIHNVIVKLQAGGGQASGTNWNTYGNGGGSGAAAILILNFDYTNLSSFRIKIPWTTKNTGGESSGASAGDIQIYFNTSNGFTNWRRIGDIGGGEGGHYGGGASGDAGKGGNCNFNTDYLNEAYYIINQVSGVAGTNKVNSGKPAIQPLLKTSSDSRFLYEDHEGVKESPLHFKSAINGSRVFMYYINGSENGGICGVGAPSPFGTNVTIENLPGGLRDAYYREGYRGSGGWGGATHTGSATPGGQGGQPFIKLYF